MAAVAERLGIAGAATAQARLRHARDDAAGAAGDLQIAAHLQRAIRLQIDCERAVAHDEHLGLVGRRRLARGGEADCMVRTVAIGFVLRCTTAAQRGAEDARLTVETHIRAHRVGSRLADGDQVDGRRRLVMPAVLAPVTDRTRWADVRDLDQALHLHGVGLYPWAFHVGEKHFWRAGDAETRMDALLAFIEQREILALDEFDTRDDGGHRRCGGRRRNGGLRRRDDGSHRRGGIESKRRSLGEIGELARRGIRARIAAGLVECRRRRGQFVKAFDEEARGARPGRQRRRIAQRGEGHAGVAIRI